MAQGDCQGEQNLEVIPNTSNFAFILPSIPFFPVISTRPCRKTLNSLVTFCFPPVCTEHHLFEAELHH